jgi:hypothetical protein
LLLIERKKVSQGGPYEARHQKDFLLSDRHNVGDFMSDLYQCDFC